MIEKLEIPEDWVKKKSKTCIVCGYNPNSRENWTCNHWGKIVNYGKHQYIYYGPPAPTKTDKQANITSDK